jgi:hypothetical protein
MSTQDFDNLASALANKAISRRSALRMAAAAALGAAGLGAAAREGQAQEPTFNPTCPTRGTGCNRLCQNTDFTTCFCIRTTSGKRRCVNGFCPEKIAGCNGTHRCNVEVGGFGNICMKSPCCGTPPSTCGPNNDQPCAGVCVKVCGQDRGPDSGTTGRFGR